jgi:hypothetical protein
MNFNIGHGIIAILCLCSCSSLQFSRMSNHVLLQSPHKQFSCYSGSANNSSNCCYPYEGKLMLCTYVSYSGIGNDSGSVVIRIVPDNK